MMKRLIFVLLGTLALAACSSGGDSKSSGGGGSTQMPAPSSYSGTRTLFTNKWKKTYSEGTAIFDFAPDSVTLSNFCKNGKSASMTVRARNTSTHIQILESKRTGDSNCYVISEASIAETYTINGNFLITSDAMLDAY